MGRTRITELAAARRPRRSREGNVAILTALTLTLLMMFGALAFDVGNVVRTREELQSAMDAAALAGAAALDGTAAGITAAKNQAQTYANYHYAYSGSHLSVPNDATFVEVGHWNFNYAAPGTAPGSLAAGQCLQKVSSGRGDCFTAATSNEQTTAVRVHYQVNAVSHPFAAVAGNRQGPVWATATAVGCGSQSEGCGFPLVIPACVVTDEPGSCNFAFTNASSVADNAGWTSFGGSNGQPVLYSALVAACTDNPSLNGNRQDCDPRTPWLLGGCHPTVDGTTQECIGRNNCSQATDANDATTVGIQNGNTLSGGGPGSGSNNDICRLIKDILKRGAGSEAAFPLPLYFTISAPVTESGTSGNCASPASTDLTGNHPVLGYTKIDIYGVQCNGDAGITWDALHGFAVPPPCNNSQGLCIYAKQHCDTTPDTSSLGGGGCYGTSARKRLVQ